MNLPLPAFAFRNLQQPVHSNRQILRCGRCFRWLSRLPDFSKSSSEYQSHGFARIGRFWKTAVWTLETCMIWSRHQWHHWVFMQIIVLKSESSFIGFHSAAIWPGSIVRSYGRGKLQWPNVCHVAKATTLAVKCLLNGEWHVWCCKAGTSELSPSCILGISWYT